MLINDQSSKTSCFHIHVIPILEIDDFSVIVHLFQGFNETTKSEKFSLLIHGQIGGDEDSSDSWPAWPGRYC